jgi:4-hydroxybenzoate polyprenyltransferase/phosphoserine phosphatase
MCHEYKASIHKPICTDLDGTLVMTDLLIESILSIFTSRRGLANLPRLSASSRAGLKRQAAILSKLAPDQLPYNLELVTFLREQKRLGRRVVLATAADERTARAIADHLELFDEVVASDGVRNLKGEAKAAELVQRFGRNGFDYIGNDSADLAVWREAEGIILVNASRAVTRKARTLGKVIAEISNRPPVLSMALRAMRPQQWVKNLLVFVPLLTSRSFDDLSGLLGAICIFVSFCASASGIYLVNDLMDLSADRHHPRKRDRPLASGALPLLLGIVLAGALIVTGIGLAFLAGATLPLLTYAAASLAYSVVLKQYPLVDAFVLSALYTLRIIAGGIASQHPVTLWLLAFSGFTFLSLAFVKRVGELTPGAGSGSLHPVSRRGYFPEDNLVLQMFGTASAFASANGLALFVGTSAALQPYQNPELLWGLVPLILFWQCRLWLSTARGHMHDDPIVYASRDWVSWIVAASVLAIVLLSSWRLTF